MLLGIIHTPYMSVCVCVCNRERERDQRERQRPAHVFTQFSSVLICGLSVQLILL